MRERQEKPVPLLKRFKAWLDQAVHPVLPKDSLGIAVNYALKHWDALTNFTIAGHLEASNNFAERCMRSVAVGRKAFLFVGSDVRVTRQRSTIHWWGPARRIKLTR